MAQAPAMNAFLLAKRMPKGVKREERQRESVETEADTFRIRHVVLRQQLKQPVLQKVSS
ncbi:hypothetical protein M5D96_012254 [Drosophila gunungcola]|uniref:Uncharacterized protein n=1 Tax=Drosophila gunungcola TaxID=103775 RepID=A0A9Q0BJL4_9MUSC|nr:hypothetical protein M5D96_012254 [Drosophila gunungcola]